MKTTLLAAGIAVFLLTACSFDASEEAPADQPVATDETLPEIVIGGDLGPLQPPDEVAFCEAVGLAPVRWLTDTVVPLQFWVSTFDSVGDTPPEAAAAAASLIEYGERRLAWNFGADTERPEWGDAQVADAMALADAAITLCPNLPLVAGLPGTSDTPVGWGDLDEASIAQRCADDQRRVAAAIVDFSAEFGRQPRHQIEMEPVLDLFFASDWHGVMTDAAGNAVVVAVPGGACDLG